MTANTGFPIVQRPYQMNRSEGAETVERAERLQSRQRPLRCQQLFQVLLRVGRLPPLEHHLRQVALPARGAVQGGDQLGDIEPIQPWDRPWPGADGIDPVESSLV